MPTHLPFKEYFKYKTNTLIANINLNISKNIRILPIIPESSTAEIKFVEKVMQALERHPEEYQIITLHAEEEFTLIDFLPAHKDVSILLMGVSEQQLGFQFTLPLYSTFKIQNLKITSVESPAIIAGDKEKKAKLWHLIKNQF